MRAAPGGLCCFHSRLSGHWEGFGPSPPLKELLRKHLMGAGVQRGAGSVPTPGHCIRAKVSHSVGTRGRPWGAASPALPGLQSADKAWPPPPPPPSPALQGP